MRHQQGFTLIEVVVAFAIFVLCVGALYELFASGARRTAQANDRQWALLTAQSLLSQHRVLHAGWPSVEEGTLDRETAWKITAVPYDVPLREGNQWQAFWVTVTVQDRLRPARMVTLDSLEVALKR